MNNKNIGKIIYVAGPFRGSNSWHVENNIRSAEYATYELAKQGFTVICPHTMYRHFDGTLTEEYWLKATLEIMTRCDAIYVCSEEESVDGMPEWQTSVGTIGEVEMAKRLEIPVFFKGQCVNFGE